MLYLPLILALQLFIRVKKIPAILYSIPMAGLSHRDVLILQQRERKRQKRKKKEAQEFDHGSVHKRRISYILRGGDHVGFLIDSPLFLRRRGFRNIERQMCYSYTAAKQRKMREMKDSKMLAKRSNEIGCQEPLCMYPTGQTLLKFIFLECFRE